MTIQKIIPKSEKSLKPTSHVNDFNNIYIRQAIQDLLDTLREKQRTLDIEFPNAGGGVGLAANQIEYPYKPASDNDESPQRGYYPKDFTPPNIYVLSIRPMRAALEKCEVVPPSVYINAKFRPLLSGDVSYYGEGCLSVTGFKGFGIPRYKSILVQAYNENGEELNFVIDGFIASAHQHEIDHGLGMEYLNRLDFSDAELRDVSLWIDSHENKIIQETEISEWIIKNKLKCTLKEPDFKALRTWTNNELLKRQNRNSVETEDKGSISKQKAPVDKHYTRFSPPSPKDTQQKALKLSEEKSKTYPEEANVPFFIYSKM